MTETPQQQQTDSDMIFLQLTSGGFETIAGVEQALVAFYVPDMTISRAGISHALGRLRKHFAP